jgi:hypothetical protein
MSVRLTMRVLALASLGMFGVALVWGALLYLGNPCPAGFGQLTVILLPDVGVGFGLPLALIGSVPAAILASVRRQWGWLAGLLIASGSSLVLLFALSAGGEPFERFPAAALIWAFDHVFGPTCGYGSPPFSKGLGLALPFLATPVVLLAYGYSPASAADTDPSRGAAENAIIARRLLWGSAIVALAFGVLLGGLRLVSYLQLANVSPFETTPGMTSRYYGYSPFNTPAGMLAAYVISPIGVLLAFVLGGALAVRAFRRREWGWFAGLLAVELVTLLVFGVYYGSQPSFYVPILYRWPALALISVALPIPLPLVSLAYAWRRVRHLTTDRTAVRPAPASL